jgi:tetratricopeptide (TPR) repeat protein
MEDQNIERAHLLYDQERYADAIKAVNQALSSEPNDIELLALLALCHMQTDELVQSKQAIEAAISIEPDSAHLLHIKSVILANSRSMKEALDFANQAIALDPEEASYFSIKSYIHYEQKDYEGALDAADMALSLDAEHIDALNNRSRALLRLKRTEDSWSTIEEALHQDPNNDSTHATYAWSLLEKGEPQKALHHFTEALRLNPNNEYAQYGMSEALKARYAVYRWFLSYTFWMSSLTSKYQWGVIIGFYIGFKGIRNLAKYNESLQPFLYPLIGLLALVAMTTWIATPLSNLFLRLNKYGEHLLDDEDKRTATGVGVCLGLSLISLLVYVAFSTEPWLVLAAASFAMMIPVSSFYMETKIPNLMKYYTLGLLLLAALTVFQAFTGVAQLGWAMPVFIFGFIAFQWVANYQAIEQE